MSEGTRRIGLRVNNLRLARALCSAALAVVVTSVAVVALQGSATTTRDSALGDRSPFISAEAVRDGESWVVRWSTRDDLPVTVSVSVDGKSTWDTVKHSATKVSVPVHATVSHPWFRLQPSKGAPLEITTRSLGLTSV